jgi:hypothetical protein
LVDFAELIVYVVALAAILLIPEFYDIYRSYNEKEKLRGDVEPLIADIRAAIKPVAQGKPESLDTLKELVEKLTAPKGLAEKLAAPTEGLEGLGRVVMTFGVIMILGIAVIQLTLSSTSLINSVVSAPANSPMLNQTLTFADKARSDQVDILKTVMTALAGGLTTMIGFYFGTKAAEPKSETTQ